MRVVTLNLNGIRSATSKGVFRWLRRQHADVVCFQEMRAQAEQYPPELTRLRSWHKHVVDAKRKGYSGVAVLSRRQPDEVTTSMGYRPFDVEGRYLRVRFGKLSVVSVYVPSGSHREDRQAFKMRALGRFRQHLRELKASGQSCIVCGDLNIAHKRIDLENWRGNQKHSGFLPEERRWMDRLYQQEGWVDAFRVVDPRPKQYTWWSNRGRAWAKNVGWRLDYQVCTPDLEPYVREAHIYKNRRFSDHAPLTIDYDYDW